MLDTRDIDEYREQKEERELYEYESHYYSVEGN